MQETTGSHKGTNAYGFQPTLLALFLPQPGFPSCVLFRLLPFPPFHRLGFQPALLQDRSVMEEIEKKKGDAEIAREGVAKMGWGWEDAR